MVDRDLSHVLSLVKTTTAALVVNSLIVITVGDLADCNRPLPVLEVCVYAFYTCERSHHSSTALVIYYRSNNSVQNGIHAKLYSQIMVCRYC